MVTKNMDKVSAIVVTLVIVDCVGMFSVSDDAGLVIFFLSLCLHYYRLFVKLISIITNRCINVSLHLYVRFYTSRSLPHCALSPIVLFTVKLCP